MTDGLGVDTAPLDSKGRATAEDGANLLRLENGQWQVMDLKSSRRSRRFSGA